MPKSTKTQKSCVYFKKIFERILIMYHNVYFIIIILLQNYNPSGERYFFTPDQNCHCTNMFSILFP